MAPKTCAIHLDHHALPLKGQRIKVLAYLNFRPNGTRHQEKQKALPPQELPQDRAPESGMLPRAMLPPGLLPQGERPRVIRAPPVPGETDGMRHQGLKEVIGFFSIDLGLAVTNLEC